MAQARNAFQHGRWQVAAQRTERVLAISPQYAGAKKLHQRAAPRARLEPTLPPRALTQAERRTRRRAGLREAGPGRRRAVPGARKLLARVQSGLAAQAAAQAPAPPPAAATPAYTPPPPAPAPAPTPPPP